MNTDENKVNEFEEEWIQGETDLANPDAESAAVIEAARVEVAKGEDEYMQAHADLESENK